MKTWKMKALVYAAAITMSCFLLTPQIVESQDVKHISGDKHTGYTTKQQMTELFEYVARNNERAFTMATLKGLADGTITFFKDGEEVYVTGKNIILSPSPMNVIKVRRVGEITEYWTNGTAVK